MINLGTISIKGSQSIILARNKIRTLTGDLKFNSVNTTMLTSVTSSLGRLMLKTDENAGIAVRLEKQGGKFSLVLVFQSLNTETDFKCSALETVFDRVQCQRIKA